MLNIPWDDHIPHKPFSTQLAFLAIPHLDAFFGGAAGGGKDQLLVTSCNASKLGYDLSNPNHLEEFAMKFGQKVATPFGFKLIDDIKVGDQVVNPDGTTTRVIAEHFFEDQTCYRITFVDGVSCIVGEGHLWSVKTSGIRNRRKVEDPYVDYDEFSPQQRFNTELLRRYKTVTTKELAALHAKAMEQSENDTRSHWLSVPLTEPVNFQLNKGRTKAAPPYALGIWLGDGSSSSSQKGSTNSVKWFKPEPAIKDAILQEFEDYKFPDTVSEHFQEGSYGIVGGEFAACLDSMKLGGKLAWEKFIPTQYLYAPIPERWSLIQGLMDSDGTVSPEGKCYFCSTSERLIDDFCTLARSLGFTATKSYKEEPIYTHNGKTKIGRPAWIVYINGRNRANLFRAHSKKVARAKDSNTEGGRRILSVLKLPGTYKTKCITVAHPNSLYMTNDFIVTHNSDVLLMAALQYVSYPGYAALLIRRSLTELKQPGALLDRAHQWLSGTDATWHGDEHTWSFPTKWPNGTPGPPSKLQFGYLGDFAVEQRYQGAEYQFVGVDESSHFETDYAPLYLFSRLRKLVCPIHKLKKDPTSGDMVPNYIKGCHKCQVYSSVPVRFRLASNPGGPGHRWLKDRYRIEKEIYETIDPDTKEPIKRVKFVGKHPNKPFVPSNLTDNIFIDQRSYRMSLQELDEVRKAQLEHGDWDISPDSRFKLQWLKFYKSRGDYFDLAGTSYSVKDLLRTFVTVDPAATVKAGPIDQSMSRKGPSHTVISVWGLTPDYQLIWIYMRRFRKEIPDVVDQIVEVNKIFKPQYIKMETNGVGLGAAQLAMMKGVPVKPNPKSKDKLENAANAIYRMRSGRIWFPEQAPWLKEAMDEIFTWTGHPDMTDDIVDTLSDAANDVTWLAQGSDPIFERQTTMPGHLPKVVPMSTGYLKQFHNGPGLW